MEKTKTNALEMAAQENEKRKTQKKAKKTCSKIKLR